MLTLISPRGTLALVFLITAVVIGALAVSAASGADEAPDEIIQGDLNCDGSVNATDTLVSLRHAGGLAVEQTEPCPDVGTLAAIPGPEGPEGPQGPAGPAGPAGISGFQVITSQSGTGSQSPTIHDAECPAGMKIVGGGAEILGASFNDISLHSSAPSPGLTGWRGIASEVNGTGQDWSIKVTAFCANA